MIFSFTKTIPFEHHVFFPKKLSSEQIKIIETHSNFYKKLSPKHKISYEHRVAKFLKRYPFIGRENLIITDEIKIAIATTAVKSVSYTHLDVYKRQSRGTCKTSRHHERR